MAWSKSMIKRAIRSITKYSKLINEMMQGIKLAQLFTQSLLCSHGLIHHLQKTFGSWPESQYTDYLHPTFAFTNSNRCRKDPSLALQATGSPLLLIRGHVESGCLLGLGVCLSVCLSLVAGCACGGVVMLSALICQVHYSCECNGCKPCECETVSRGKSERGWLFCVCRAMCCINGPNYAPGSMADGSLQRRGMVGGSNNMSQTGGDRGEESFGSVVVLSYHVYYWSGLTSCVQSVAGRWEFTSVAFMRTIQPQSLTVNPPPSGLSNDFSACFIF